MNFVDKSYNMKKTPTKRVSQDESAIRVLSKRVGLVDEVLQEILLKMDKFEGYLTQLTSKVNKVYDKVHERPDYYTVGQIALKEQVCEKTVRRKIQEQKIPATKREGDKSYKISTEAYFDSLESDGRSVWFKNHS